MLLIEKLKNIKRINLYNSGYLDEDEKGNIKVKKDFTEMDTKQLKTYIKRYWETIYEVMKDGNLSTVYNMSVGSRATSKNFKTVTVELNAPDNKIKSSIVRISTNYAKKNPGVFITLNNTTLKFTLLKDEDFLSILKPLFEKLIDKGYENNIQYITGEKSKQFSKL